MYRKLHKREKEKKMKFLDLKNLNIWDLRRDRSCSITHFHYISDIEKELELGYICIPTNGVVSSSGLAVMGAGLARDAADKFPYLSLDFGSVLNNFGNQVFLFRQECIFCFPTKNDFRETSSLELIKQSCHQLKTLVNVYRINKPIYLPKVGSGLGMLPWPSVKEILTKELRSEQFICLEGS